MDAKYECGRSLARVKVYRPQAANAVNDAGIRGARPTGR
jgi:hypothetical protein